MDTGMIIHLEDLQTEIVDAEKIVGDLRGKLFLSQDAILCTDLERAEEALNKVKNGGKSEGGTGRGISPAYANYYSRL
jgi:adenylosuccinate synthase